MHCSAGRQLLTRRWSTSCSSYRAMKLQGARKRMRFPMPAGHLLAPSALGSAVMFAQVVVSDEVTHHWRGISLVVDHDVALS